MRTQTPLAFLFAASMSLSVAAQSVVTCSIKELHTHPFVLRVVSIQITELNGYKVFDRDRKFSGRAHLALTLENKSTQQFQKFDPQDLSFVGKDGIQVFPVFQRNLADETLPMSLNLAPGAHAATEYALTGRLNFPVKIYVGETLVAEVVE